MRLRDASVELGLTSSEVGDRVVDEFGPRWTFEELVRRVHRLPRPEVDLLAAETLHDKLIQRERQATLSVERASTSSSKRPRKGTRERWEWEQSPAGQKLLAAEHEIDTRHRSELRKLFDDYRQELRVQWTDELLASTFALADGTRITWGEATVEQHRERVSIFMGNAAANLDGAARHQQAIEELSANGKRTLGDLVAAA